MRIKKIKVTGESKINIVYEVQKGESWDEFSFTCSDAPKASFHEALQALAEDVVEMCELPEDYKERIIVKGISFSYGGEMEVMGATVTAQMKLHKSNCPLNLNTPHKASESYSGDEMDADPAQLLPEGCYRRLDLMTIEAEDYIRGIRAQTELFERRAA